VTDERPIGEDDLQAFVDGRLTPGRLDAVEAYLAANPVAAEQVRLEIEQRKALRARLAFKGSEPIPARLRVANLMAGRRRPSAYRWRAVAAAMAWLAIGLTVGGVAGAWVGRGTALPPGPEATDAAGDAIAAYRTYVGEKLHPVEVAADQEAHLVQWLSRRVGKPLAAPNLTRQGYRLIGGRLLPAGNEPAALFMYEDERGNRLTLYARSGGAGEQTAFRFETQEGVSAFSWIDQGLSYVVSGRTDRAQLLAVAEAAFKELESRAAAGKSKL